MQATITIILAGDSALSRKALAEALVPFDITTIAQANDGLQLLELLETQKPNVVLLNIEMPVMDGNIAFDRIRDKFPAMKVIVVSRYIEEGVMGNYIRRGVKGYLHKDLADTDMKKFAECINEVAAGRSVYYNGLGPGRRKYTRRETEIIPLLCQGKTSKEIGNNLGISEKYTNNLRYSLYKKTNSRNGTEFVQYCIINGLHYMGRQ